MMVVMAAPLMGLLVAAGESGPPPVAVELLAGVGFRDQSTGDGWGTGFVFGASVGVDLAPRLDWPLTVQLLGVSDTLGRAQGVDAVAVSEWSTELCLLVGSKIAVFERDEKALGIAGGVGPGLRLTRVAIRVYEETDVTWDPGAFGLVRAGPYFAWGPARFGLDVLWGYPRLRHFQLVLGVGYSF